jgi:hypothetical protein
LIGQSPHGNQNAGGFANTDKLFVHMRLTCKYYAIGSDVFSAIIEAVTTSLRQIGHRFYQIVPARIYGGYRTKLLSHLKLGVIDIDSNHLRPRAQPIGTAANPTPPAP